MGRPKINPDTIDKICPTCKKTFTISFYLRNRRTYCSKSCSNNNPKVIEKIITSQNETYMKNYGMHPMKTDQTKENLRKSLTKKYGVDWYSKYNQWYDKVKNTRLERYGDESYTNREKSKKTCIEKYGVDNPSKCKKIHDCIDETKRTIHYNHITEYCKNNSLYMLFSREDYKGYHFSNIYRFRCNKCSYIFDSSVYNLESLFCEKCDPGKKDTLENNFFMFLSSLQSTMIIKRHDRTILYGKELDFYLPDKKLAIELNGLYWHSENGSGKLKNYHLNKTKSCLGHGIRLIHIFENEWRDKPELVKSVIKTILKLQTSNVIQARKCDIKEITIKEKNDFLNKNHLQQEDKSTIKIGLYYDNNLVSVMTFRDKSRFDNNVEWELSRFCNLQDTIVIGGASKLFSYFIKNYNPKSIVSYNDRRYFSGDLYHILGFSFVSNTPPSYHYITPDYKNIVNRLNFQKHLLKKKLPLFDANISEWENMKNNGWDRIWDCGCGKWIFRNPNFKP